MGIQLQGEEGLEVTRDLMSVCLVEFATPDQVAYSDQLQEITVDVLLFGSKETEAVGTWGGCGEASGMEG